MVVFYETIRFRLILFGIGCSIKYIKNFRSGSVDLSYLFGSTPENVVRSGQDAAWTNRKYEGLKISMFQFSARLSTLNPINPDGCGGGR